MSATKAYIADRIFTGDAWLEDHAIIIEKDLIAGVIPSANLSPDIITENYTGHIIAPAFIDLQIYGAYEKLLAVYPLIDSLYKLNDYCRKGGTANCLPTLATNTREIFFKSIDAIREYWDNDGEGILGLHLEGPWINPEKRGAHISSLIHAPVVKEVMELLDYGKGIIKMITLAPEVCSREIIDLILSHNIIISAGHSNATYAEALKGFEKGITVVTHLYNAMSSFHHREPGLTGAAFDHTTVMASVIPDGHHVDYAAIRIAKQVMKERLFVITDAVTDTIEGFYQHKMAGDKFVAAGILSGSALTMSRALKNLVQYAKIELAEALKMCSLYPARVMKLDNELGKIAKGFRASLVILDKELEAAAVI